MTTYLHQVLKLKIGGAVFPFSPYAFNMRRANILLYFTCLQLHASKTEMVKVKVRVRKSPYRPITGV
jgi:hypothetical protein